METWKQAIAAISQRKSWEEGITLLQKVLANNSDDASAYLIYSYFIMNILAEEDYSEEQGEKYQPLLKNNFKLGIEKYSNDSSFLLFSGIIAYMSEWYLDLDIVDARRMLEKAYEENPHDRITNWVYNIYVLNKYDSETIVLSKEILEDKNLQEYLISYLSIIGNYILGLIHHWYEQNINIIY